MAQWRAHEFFVAAIGPQISWPPIENLMDATLDFCWPNGRGLLGLLRAYRAYREAPAGLLCKSFGLPWGWMAAIALLGPCCELPGLCIRFGRVLRVARGPRRAVLDSAAL